MTPRHTPLVSGSAAAQVVNHEDSDIAKDAANETLKEAASDADDTQVNVDAAAAAAAAAVASGVAEQPPVPPHSPPPAKKLRAAAP